MSGTATAGNAAGLLVPNSLESFISPAYISGFVKEKRIICNVATMLAQKTLPNDFKNLLYGSSAEYAWVPRTAEENASCGMDIDETTCNFQNDEADQEKLELEFASVKVCHQKKGTFKLPRTLLARALDNGKLVQQLIKNQIFRQLDARLDNLGLRSLPGYAAADNIETPDLGTIANPLPTSTDAEIKRVLSALKVRAMQLGMNCAPGSNVKVIADPWTYQKIVWMIGNGTLQCTKDNSLITGEIQLALGLNIVPTPRAACYFDGTNYVRYLVLVDTSDFFLPFRWLYGADAKWQEIGHDYILPFAYIYDSIVFDPESIIVATIDP